MASISPIYLRLYFLFFDFYWRSSLDWILLTKVLLIYSGIRSFGWLDCSCFDKWFNLSELAHSIIYLLKIVALLWLCAGGRVSSLWFWVKECLPFKGLLSGWTESSWSLSCAFSYSDCQVFVLSLSIYYNACFHTSAFTCTFPSCIVTMIRKYNNSIIMICLNLTLLHYYQTTVELLAIDQLVALGWAGKGKNNNICAYP